MSIEPESLNQAEEVINFASGRVQLYPASMQIVRDGEVLENITSTQGRVLSVLAQTPGAVVSPAELSQQLYGYTDAHSIQSARVHLMGLRRALGTDLDDPTAGAIRTQRSAGYYIATDLDIALGDFDPTSSGVVKIGDDRVEIKPDERKVRVDGRPIESIYGGRLIILLYLAAMADRTVSYDLLTNGIGIQRGSTPPSFDVLRTLVSNLRRDLGKELGNERTGAIRTTAKVGYRAVSSLTV